jgi:GGDEF domain-containing protein
MKFPYRRAEAENDTLEARVEERSKDLLRLAYYDELTGLLNRHGVFNLVKYFGITPGNVTVFLINLARFKQINDGMGHEAGDMVLRQVAQRLEALASQLNQDIFGNVDCQVGRWGATSSFSISPGWGRRADPGGGGRTAEGRNQPAHAGGGQDHLRGREYWRGVRAGL